MNEKITATCPSCQAQFRVAPGLMGKRAKCPKCQSPFTIGDEAQPPPMEQQEAPPQDATVPLSGGSDVNPQSETDGIRTGQQEPHRGALIMTLGFLGLACGFFGIFAILMGRGDLKKIDRGLMDPNGAGTTKSGVLLGWIGCCLMLIGFMIFVLVPIVGTLVVANFSGIQGASKEKTAQNQLETLGEALNIYQLDMNSYPDPALGLLALQEPPQVEFGGAQWRGPYLKSKEIPLDPWGGQYFYALELDEFDQQVFKIWCAGPNGEDEDGGGDDIVEYSN